MVMLPGLLSGARDADICWSVYLRALASRLAARGLVWHRGVRVRFALLSLSSVSCSD
jgi:hypothetical protein